jgi:superfamily II DNA or RNA helicase/HKD family nuclease
MTDPKGVFEEILHKNKSYPSNQHTFPLLPQQYNGALIQQVMREINVAYNELAQQDQYAKILELTNDLRKVIQQAEDVELNMPLKAIHYRDDDQTLPFYPEFFLSHPYLLTNSASDPFNLFKALKYELMTADRANFMVSFIRWSGMQLLIRSIDDFRKSDSTRKLRILTSTYLKVTEPKALRRLLEIPNVETRVFDSGKVSFHTKAYLFERQSGLHTAIIGSSNLSYSALQTGYEWNVKLPSGAHIAIYERANGAFQRYWDDPRAIPLQEAFIQEYEKEYNNKKVMLVNPYIAAQHIDFAEIVEEQATKDQPIQPNSMQQEALEALKQTRANGHDKGVIIAATGTGKTYLSAFDVRNFGAKRMLFLAHRDEILESAQATFKDVFGSNLSCGKLSGTSKEGDKPYLFSTVQTLSREEVLNQYPRDYFDYVVVDEFHHAEAATYRKVIEHFQPKFLMGLTATPDRMDGRDVLALCDHNVVYEIRLRDALKEGLLAPFRYFGLSDPTINYEDIETQNNGQFVENELVRALNTHERVDYVIEMMQKFSYDGSILRALGFCASIEHARYMSAEFNKRGFVTGCLTGEDSPEQRQLLISRLENDEDPLQIIFTVNIFNEGVDIPKLNVILFLRPTESATIFIQQLGRGLRKIPGKAYVTVLDFIGNYHKSFIVPLALSGQHNHKAFDRDSLRVAIETEFADLPDGCFVDLEEVSRQQILNKIENVRMDRDAMLMDLYNQFRKELGNSPEINDFLYFDGAPSLHFFVNKYGSWVQTKKKMRDMSEFDLELLEDSLRLQMVQRLESMLPVKWPYEIAVLAVSLKKNEVTVEDVIVELQYRFAINLTAEVQGSKIERAMEKLAAPTTKHKWSWGSLSEGVFTLSSEVKDSIGKDAFLAYFSDRIEYGLAEFRRVYRPNVFFSSDKNVVLYQNYTRNDLIYLFESTAQEGSWREGVSRVDNHYLLFINLNKGEKVADHLNYHDYFVDQQHFHWQSQNATSHESQRGQEYIHHKEKGMHVHLFIRKFEDMHGVTLPFTYLGEVDYESSHGDKPMNINWRLHQPIPESLYNDFIR